MILQLDRGCWHFLSTALTDITKFYLSKHRLCIGCLMFKVTEKSSKNILASCQMSNTRFAWTFFEILYINSPSPIISHLFNNHPHCSQESEKLQVNLLECPPEGKRLESPQDFPIDYCHYHPLAYTSTQQLRALHSLSSR